MKKVQTRKTSKVNNMSIQKCSEADIVNLLLGIAKNRRLAENYVNKFRANSQLSHVFNYEDVSGELKATLVQVLNAWKTYQQAKGVKKIKIPKHLRVNMSSKLKLDTVSHIEGYFINAFKNNMSKIYTKYKTEKRSACRQTVGLDDQNMEKHEKNAIESAMAVTPMEDLEFDTTMSQIKTYLQDEDLKRNEQLIAEYGSMDAVPDKKKNDLAGLWDALQDPSIKKEMEKVKERFGWTEHVFKKNRETLEHTVRKNFLSEGRELLKHVIDKNSAAYFNKDAPDKKQKEMKAEKKPVMELHTVFSMKTDPKNKKKKKYSMTISLDEFKEGTWVSLKQKTKELDSAKAKDFDDAKSKLKATASKEIEYMQKSFEKLRFG